MRLDLDHRFDHHPPSSTAVRAAHACVREACKRLAHDVDAVVPETWEKQQALIHIEQAMFWANAAIARTQGAFAPDEPETPAAGGAAP